MCIDFVLKKIFGHQEVLCCVYFRDVNGTKTEYTVLQVNMLSWVLSNFFDKYFYWANNSKWQSSKNNSKDF